jgi:hypothetical protein
MNAAILIYHFAWHLKEPELVINGSIKLCKSQGTRVYKHYLEQCKKYNIDDGEPFSTDFHIEINADGMDESFPYWHTASSQISKICNLISILTSQPISFYRVLLSNDNFKSALPLADIYSNYDLQEHLHFTTNITPLIRDKLSSLDMLLNEKKGIDNDFVAKLMQCREFYFSSLKQSAPLSNALQYYFNAWRAYEEEQACINYAVVLESLFSPTGNTEINHRIAYNTAHFFDKRPEYRRKIYNTIKEFYNLRSKIVHGGSSPKWRDPLIYSGVMFVVSSKILETILLDAKYREIFSSPKMRYELIDKWLFENK